MVLRKRGSRLDRVLPVGRYTLERYERVCRRRCKPEPPIVRCTRPLRLSPGRTFALLVVVDYSRETCRIKLQLPSRRRETLRVKRTIKSAVRTVVVDGDLSGACRFATPLGRRRLLEGYNSSSTGPNFSSCEEVLRYEIDGYPQTVKKLRRGGS